MCCDVMCCITFIHHIHHTLYRCQHQSLYIIGDHIEPSRQHHNQKHIDENGEEGRTLVIGLITDNRLVVEGMGRKDGGKEMRTDRLRDWPTIDR